MTGRFTFSKPRAALVWTLFVIVSGLFPIGCGASREKIVEETIEQTHPIDPTDTLSIRNPAGSVRISGSDDPLMKLTATKKAGSIHQLKEIAVRVTARSGTLSLETIFPPQKAPNFSNRSGTVDYTISLPRTVKISRIELGNGNLVLEGMRGDLRANLVNGTLTTRNCLANTQFLVANGGLELLYENLERRRFSVEATIINGNARTVLPRAGPFHLAAEALNGNVSNKFAPIDERPSKATKVSVSIGAELQSEITIRATHGDIELAPAEAGESTAKENPGAVVSSQRQGR